mmetsp:Transcript_4576/g.9635  ORF Transcript_4576/g.9635 Transcript_4576/m.9635 type:complete len:204 (+) Transcript_4576:86-697(+)
MVTAGTVFSMRKEFTTLRMSAASRRKASPISSAISGGASSPRRAIWLSTASVRATEASSESTSAESTTFTSRSVMPPRAETTAIVGMVPLPRPPASRMSRSPTVRYSSAVAREAPPNLCTSQALVEPAGRTKSTTFESTSESRSTDAATGRGGTSTVAPSAARRVYGVRAVANFLALNPKGLNAPAGETAAARASNWLPICMG